MREINSSVITQAVAKMCVEANTSLPPDVRKSIVQARSAEDWPVAQDILDRIIENYTIGDGTPICQDTGMA